MGEFETKPIESVKDAPSLFGKKGDQLKRRSSSVDLEVEKEKVIGGLEKEWGNYRLQIEAKNAAYMTAFLQLEYYKKTAEEFSVLLKNCKLERDRFIKERDEVKNQMEELESKMKGMVDQLSETAKIREQLSHVLNELKVTRADLITMETELAAAKDSELKAMTQAELMEVSANVEKEKSKELLGRVSELQDSVIILKLAVNEAEKEKCRIVSEKDAEMESLKATAFQAQEQIEDLRKQLGTVELENQLQTQSAFIDLLQAKLEQVTNILGSIENTTSDGGIDLNQIKQDLEFKERKTSDQALYLEALETELNRLKLELENANEEEVVQKENQVPSQGVEAEECENSTLNYQAEMSPQGALISHVDDRRDKSVDHITIPIDKHNSLIQNAEKADQFSNSLAEDSKQLATESEKKKEVELLKKELEAAMVKIKLFRNRAEQASTRAEAAEKAKAMLEDQLTMWQEQKQKRKAALPATMEESTPKQLHPSTSTTVKAAENAEATLEDQLTMCQEPKQKRKAALAALREETTPKQLSPPTPIPTIQKSSTKYLPLGKILNMKF